MSAAEQEERALLRSLETDLERLEASEKIHTEQLALIAERRGELSRARHFAYSRLNRVLAGMPPLKVEEPDPDYGPHDVPNYG